MSGLLLELLVSWARDPLVLVSVIVSLLVVQLCRFAWKVRSLPKGPTPLPIIGNILQLRAPRPLYEKAVTWAAQYGDPLTIWLGHRPIVIASTKDSFKDIAGPHRNNLAGRMKTNLGDVQSRGFEDVVFSDFNPAWDVLRRVAHVAMRKYAKSDRLAELAAARVDAEINDVFGADVSTSSASVEVMEFIENIINNVIATSAFGAGFEKGNADYEELRHANKVFEQEGPNGLPSDILPILGWVFFRRERLLRKILKSFMDVNDRMFQKAKESYEPGVTPRHFTDTLLKARDEFIAEDRGSAKYLTDENLRQAVFDIFGAGTGTTRTILGFAFLRLAADEAMQYELREEVQNCLGIGPDARECQTADRAALPKLDAFIQEVIRFHPAAPLALPRRALVDITINGQCIPKDTFVMINHHAVNRDADIWGKDATEFNSKRFLAASKEQLSQGATSFGIGARSCPGEKMAQADILYVLVRTLQRVRLSAPQADLTPTDSDILLDARRQNICMAKIV